MTSPRDCRRTGQRDGIERGPGPGLFGRHAFGTDRPWINSGKTAEIEPVSDSEPPAHRAEQAELRDILARAIASLAERQRLVVTLYYLEDLRLKEIGEVLGLSESRVSRLLDAGLFDLGEYMRARGA